MPLQQPIIGTPAVTWIGLMYNTLCNQKRRRASSNRYNKNTKTNKG